MAVLEKFRLNFKIDEDQDNESLTSYKNTITLFQQYLKKTMSLMEIQKRQMKGMVKTRKNLDKQHKDLLDQLMVYEDTSLQFFTDQSTDKRMLTHPDSEDIKTKVAENQEKIKNPFDEAYIWLKGEYLDVAGMHECLIGRENVMKAQLATEKKKKDDSKELEKLSAGKKTLKSVFKSKSSKESSILSLQAAIEIEEQEIEDFKKLIKFLTIYHGQIAIPKFKSSKAKLYLKALNHFCIKEISNSHILATMYHKQLELSKKA